MPEAILVSACLLGLHTRYDGNSKHNADVLAWLEREHLLAVPVCPEQLAGLPTPRPRTCFMAGDGYAVLDGTGTVNVASSGLVMNERFIRGARETLQIARLCGCRRALFKERSPSCGVHQIYRGEALVAGVGVTTALLLSAGLTVQSETGLPPAAA